MCSLHRAINFSNHFSRDSHFNLRKSDFVGQNINLVSITMIGLCLLDPKWRYLRPRYYCNEGLLPTKTTIIDSYVTARRYLVSNLRPVYAPARASSDLPPIFRVYVTLFPSSALAVSRLLFVPARSRLEASRMPSRRPLDTTRTSTLTVQIIPQDPWRLISTSLTRKRLDS